MCRKKLRGSLVEAPCFACLLRVLCCAQLFLQTCAWQIRPATFRPPDCPRRTAATIAWRILFRHALSCDPADL